jgi:hypothetical protein
MKFDKSRVYTAVNADELKVGSEVICADNLADLKFRVKTDFDSDCLLGINDEFCFYRFVTEQGRYVLAYLVSEPEKKRRMTNYELAKWLAEGNGQKREGENNFLYTTYAYKDDDSKPCRKGVIIRGWNETEWHEPEVEK